MKNPIRQGTSLILAAILVSVFALRLLDAAERNTLTIDEPHYIGVGLYLWESGDYHFYETLGFHPPLAHHLAALPLLGLDLGKRPINRLIGADLLAGPYPDPKFVRWLSRTPFVAIACLGAILVFLWASEAAGLWAGLLALSLYTLSPTILAHASLAHTDITVTVLMLQTFYTFWRWWNRPGPLRFALCGASLGLALLAKLTGLVLLPLLGLFLLALEYGIPPLGDGFRRPREKKLFSDFLLPGLRASALLAGLIVMAGAVVWVGYGFSFGMIEGIEGPYAGVPLPSFLHSLLFDVAANTRGRAIYFFGEIARDGRFWYLLPVAWAMKTPLPVLMLLAYALWPQRNPDSRGDTEQAGGQLLQPRVGAGVIFMVGLAVAVFLAIVTVWVRVPLGLRYLLPIIPLLALFMATRLSARTGARRWAVVAAVVWLGLVGAWVHPHYLSYFNVLAGGPAGGHRFLVDSNFDWGQDLGALAEEVAARGNPPIWIGYFGPERPELYGLNAKPLPSCRPVKGMVAISATLLRGLYSVDNPFVAAPKGCYDWLLAREPVAQPGYSILLYEISE